MKKALLALVCVLLATGCYKNTFVNDTVPLGTREESASSAPPPHLL